MQLTELCNGQGTLRFGGAPYWGPTEVTQAENLKILAGQRPGPPLSPGYSRRMGRSGGDL